MSTETDETLRKMHKIYLPRSTSHVERVIQVFTGRETAPPSQILRVIKPSTAASGEGYPPTDRDIKDKGDDTD